MNAIRTVALGLAVATAACVNDGLSPNTAATLDANVALFAADAAGQDVEIMRGPGGRFGLGLPAAPGSFECGTIERAGMTIRRTCTFYDSTGTEQPSYDTEATASVAMHVEMSGSVDRGTWGSSSVSRVRDVVVTGLAGAETSLTWSGTGSGSMSRIRQTRDGGEVLMEMTSSETAADVVIPVPRSADGWPLSGTISTSVSVTITGGPQDGTTHERDVTITFDGTQYATVTVGAETFTVDLASRAHRGRHGPRSGGPMGQ